MRDLIIHDRTAASLEAFIARPSHSLLLHGLPGSGKTAVAIAVAGELLKVSSDKCLTHPYIHLIDAPAISDQAIESVRKLEHFLSLRVPEPGPVNRVVIISDSHTLSNEAQNALLKTIEEPPLSTLIILTADKPTGLLPTIKSRLQAVAIQRPAQSATHDYFAEAGHDKSAIQQAYLVSGGLPGLMSAMLTAEAHPLKAATDVARQLLQGSLYDRLLFSDELTKQRQLFKDVLYILTQMAQARLQVTEGAQFARWQQIMALSYEATEQLNNSGQPKLVLDSLLLKLK